MRRPSPGGLLVPAVALVLAGIAPACSSDDGDRDGEATPSTTAQTITRPGEPVQGLPPELERTSEAELGAALDAAARSLSHRAPTVEERRRFIEAFWQAELTWALGRERGIDSPRPDVEAEARRFVEDLVAEG